MSRSGMLAILAFLTYFSVNAAMAGKVVATGDSITNGYSSDKLQTKFNEISSDVQVGKVAVSGCTVAEYVGKKIDPSTGTYRDMAGEVLAMDPDVIAFMLMTNDSGSPAFIADPAPTFEDVAGVFTRFESYVNGRGRNPAVVLSTLIPRLDSTTANWQIENVINPWLRQQAQDRDFTLLDTHALITALPNWQDLYNDGIHLWANDAEGYWWMAEQFRDAAMPLVPEPATLLMLSAGLFALRRRK